MEINMEQLQYPVGRFKMPVDISETELQDAILIIKGLPSKLADAIEGLSKEQLDTPYRPGGWTVRQVVHHLADSHMNAYIRYKLALTEDHPTIKPYKEALWASLPDQHLDPALSLSLVKNIHLKWVVIMEDMSDEQWSRTFLHPEHNRVQSLRQTAMLYAWHCNHHLSHILRLKERMSW
jgi:hypothetical protein